MSHRRLTHLLFGATQDDLYKTFDVPKKTGGVRTILAPRGDLKYVQQRLNEVLHIVYASKASVHGFVRGKSIVTNARMHRGRKYVLTLDIEDFFPSINFGRVRGMFIAAPYSLGKSAATTLARICCYMNQLPQGAPTSPILSNMLCSKMDSHLLRLAQKNRCTYTRYADDITISTSMPQFPSSLAVRDQLGQVIIGDALLAIIQANGFAVNARKTRIQTRTERQEVTGLTVNEFPNVSRAYLRQVRAMLHAWGKYGLDAAEDEFRSRYDGKYRSPHSEPPSFAQVVLGKIAFLSMVRGKQNSYYRCFRSQVAQLAPNLIASEHVIKDNARHVTQAHIMTEGKSDWKHLKASLAWFQQKGEFLDLNLQFDEFDEDRGSDELLRMCKTFSKVSSESVTICVFDRDEQTIVQKVSDTNTGHKDWGRQVFSFVLPVPEHRKKSPDISIEFYYRDEEIMRCDGNCRRLYMSSEFNKVTCRHISEDLTCSDINKLNRNYTCIIDDKVYTRDEVNVALPKDRFAQYILDREPGFDDLDFSAFALIFHVIEKILSGR